MFDEVKMTPAAVKILDTAYSLFYWQGIHAVGVEMIASEAGVTKKTLYDRFGSKDQLILAYLKKRNALWEKHLNSYLEKIPNEQPIEKTIGVFKALETWLEVNSKRGCAFVNALAEITEPSHPGRKYIIEEKRRVQQQFVQYMKELGHPDAEQTGEKLFIIYEGLTVAHSMELTASGAAAAIDMAKQIIHDGQKPPS